MIAHRKIHIMKGSIHFWEKMGTDKISNSDELREFFNNLDEKGFTHLWDVLENMLGEPETDWSERMTILNSDEIDEIRKFIKNFDEKDFAVLKDKLENPEKYRWRKRWDPDDEYMYGKVVKDFGILEKDYNYEINVFLTEINNEYQIVIKSEYIDHLKCVPKYDIFSIKEVQKIRDLFDDFSIKELQKLRNMFNEALKTISTTN